jgi:hypothetical protein
MAYLQAHPDDESVHVVMGWMPLALAGCWSCSWVESRNFCYVYFMFCVKVSLGTCYLVCNSLEALGSWFQRLCYCWTGLRGFGVKMLWFRYS